MTSVLVAPWPTVVDDVRIRVRDLLVATGVGAANVAAGLLVNLASAQHSRTTAATEGAIAFVFCVIIALADRGLPPPHDGTDVLSLVRKASLALSDPAATVWLGTREVDRIIPVATSGWLTSPRVVADVVTAIAERPSVTRCVVTGPPGSGKSVLLHRLARRLCQDDSPVVAVVLPLAAYTWHSQDLRDWTASTIAQISGASPDQVRRLLDQGKILPLLDGLDEVPDRQRLSSFLFPQGDLPVLDQIKAVDRGVPADMRRELLAGLDGMPCFVLAGREDAALPVDAPAGQAASRVRLLPIRPEAVKRVLAGPVNDELLQLVRSPLYLQLALVALAVDPLPAGSPDTLRAYLWHTYLDRQLARQQRSLPGWRADQFRGWLQSYASATWRAKLEAMSVQRWPLLYGRTARIGMRVAKAAVSASLLAALGAALLTPVRYLVAVAVLTVLFLPAGEGPATRPMAPRRFGAAEFWYHARRQWAYMAFFAAGGVVLARVARTTVPWMLVAAGLGLLLGLLVPTLYELFYVPDDQATRWVRAGGTTRSTARASMVIGLAGGTIAFAVLGVLTDPRQAVAALPVCVALALLDSLGSPAAAVLLWAAQRRGPLRVERFFDVARQIGAGYTFGQLFLLDHTELHRLLAATAAPEAAASEAAAPDAIAPDAAEQDVATPDAAEAHAAAPDIVETGTGEPGIGEPRAGEPDGRRPGAATLGG